MKINKFNKAIDDTEHRYKILIQKVNRLGQELDQVRARHGVDQTDRSEGKRIDPATGSATPGRGAGSAGAIPAAGVRVSPVQSQTAAEGGKA